MTMESRRFAGRTTRTRLAWGFAVAALTLTLAFGGCRTARNNGATQPGMSHSGSSSVAGAGSQGASLRQLQGIDSQNQSDTQQFNSVQSDAGVNYGSQENQAQP